jgi:N-acetylated-alpha-linked acidic dipeptidase
VQNADKYGAVGVILYTDPSEYAPEGKNQTFPKSWWLPKTGLQSGSASFDITPGDILTPGYPSIDGIYRSPLENIPKSKTPAHEISYDDALDIFSRLKGTSSLQIKKISCCKRMIKL